MTQEERIDIVLGGARKLLQNEEHWLKHAAHDGPSWEESTRYCLVGALQKVAIGHMQAGHEEYRSDVVEGAKNRLMGILKQIQYVDIPQWNDVPSRTHEEVLRLLDRAIGGK